jgi:hypothetical protein
MAVLKQKRDKLTGFYVRCGDKLCQPRNAGAMNGHLRKCVNIVTGGCDIERGISVLAIVDKTPAQKAAIQGIAKTQAGVMLQVVRESGQPARSR